MFEDVLKLVKKSCESDAAVMPGIHVSASSYETLHNLSVAVAGSAVQRRRSGRRHSIHYAASFQQHLHTLCVTGCGGIEQGICPSEGALAHPCPSLKQLLHDC
jgi:hypothetical protein